MGVQWLCSKNELRTLCTQSNAPFEQKQAKTGQHHHKQDDDAVGSDFNDDPLWLVLAVVAYIKETGDWGILDEAVPFDNSPGTEEPLYGHLRRSIQYTLDRLGPHGLPLIGRADWNDCLNLNCFSDSPIGSATRAWRAVASRRSRSAD